jgi:hypothetical protein
MCVVDALSVIKKHNVMSNTWGHLYPEPGRKYPGYIIFSVSDYGDLTILRSEFDDLEDSPIKEKLSSEIFDNWDCETGVYRVNCELWFFKSCNDMYRSNNQIGRIIKQKIIPLVQF